MSIKNGFTIIETMISVAILAVLFSIALPSYQKYQERVDIAQVISEMSSISLALDRYFASNNEYPDSLAEINYQLNDPWGNPYYYTNIANTKGKGKLRKDKNLVPINTDYDLYSAGKDGATVGPLTAKASRDDIVRANNGGFIGKAEDF